MSASLALLVALAQFAQPNTGELRVSVGDPSGLPIQCAVELINAANQVHEILETDAKGFVAARRLAFGRYQLVITKEGFAPHTELVEIRSALPADLRITLGLAALQTQVTVSADQIVFDPHQATVVNRLGAETLTRRLSALPGRTLPDLVDTLPGWLLEANGILHPRGSEYQTQYVVDGLPLTDNRSPAFAPEIDADDVHGMAVLTGGFPAEYGRKLGGVIEITTAKQGRRGWHGAGGFNVGSFATLGGSIAAAYGADRMTVSASGGVAATDRYLDPPIEENDSNHGGTARAAIGVERDLSPADRLGVIVRRGRARFLVPNERLQLEAGQRQERDSDETSGQFSYQHIFSGRLLADVRGLVRDVSAGLWSNPASTPIVVSQDRGFRELYLRSTVTAHAGVHELKFGGDVIGGSIREAFAYTITDRSQFDRETPPQFAFEDRQTNREVALFAQDQIRFGAWTVNAGLRWDRYRLLVEDHALSPRLGVAWSWPERGLVLRASYDRAFQTPAVENLLLASSPDVEELSDEILHLPVPASRGDFLEAGFSKRLFGSARVDATVFRRTMTNAADDDVLLNTGVSFPVAFARAEIEGFEARFEMPAWRGVTGALSYSNLHGVGELPITGGLFLGEEGEELLESTDRFTISQDQRHTLRARASYQLPRGAWLAIAAAYGSGLPVELEGDSEDDDRDDFVEQFGERIVARVDFERGRVLPNFSLDASAGLTLTRAARRELRLQVDVRNLTNRLNVINFAGLFSGTAIAPPRSLALRVQAVF